MLPMNLPVFGPIANGKGEEWDDGVVEEEMRRQDFRDQMSNAVAHSHHHQAPHFHQVFHQQTTEECKQVAEHQL